MQAARRAIFILGFSLIVGSGSVASGQACNTPPAAVDDEADFFGGPVVVDVLANDSDADGEALEVFGLTTTCGAPVREDFGVVTLDLNASGLKSKCTIGYQVRDERGATAAGTVTVRDATEIFSDGFESGDLANWSVDK